MKTYRRSIASAALAAILLAGCSTGQEASETSSRPKASSTADGRGQSGEPWHDEVAPAEAGGTVGARDTPCTLPVSFTVAKSWAAEAVDGTDLPLLGERGGLTLRCEIDAKPAGHLGFLRVWTGERSGESPRQVLDRFLSEDKNITDQKYRDTTAGKLPAVEATYLVKDQPSDTTLPKRILAFDTPKGFVVMELGGLDADEHRDMLPAYVLARRSITPNS